MYWYIGLGGWVCLFVYFILCVCVCVVLFVVFFFFFKADHESLICSNKYVNFFSKNKNDLRIARVSILVIE